jgi:alginate O-acetyltransferase complex protein AlgI
MLSTDVSFYFCALTILVLFYWCRSLFAQSLVLAIGSFAMYATEGLAFLLLLTVSLVLTSVCAYFAASYNRKYSNVAVTAGVVINLAILALFKYKQMLAPLHSQPNVTWVQDFLALGLPIGISFYTFHGISLVVDAWRNPEVLRHRNNFLAHLLDTAIYLSFFPQLVAGPITRGKMFFPQIVVKRLSEVPWAEAATDIVVGLFLKRVVADNLNQLTVQLTDSRTYMSIPQTELIAMVIGYSAQIFADFAGYSLIAIGIAKLFGYRLPDNFNQPYLAQSITDFWRRWHMSLSAWLKDYLYIPLGGNRSGAVRTYINLLIVMGLGGLWHGADWKFAVWGLWHGALLALERLLGIAETSRGPITVLRVLMTFSLVTFGWLLFRLTDLSDAGLLIDALLSPYRGLDGTRGGRADVVTICLLTSIVVLFHIPRDFVRTRGPSIATIQRTKPYVLGLLCAVILMASGSRYAFIYFQF